MPNDTYDNTETRRTDSYTDGTPIIEGGSTRSLGWGIAPMIGKEPLCETEAEEAPIPAYLPSDESAPDGFKPAYGSLANMEGASDPRDESHRIGLMGAKRVFTPEGTIHPERRHGGQNVLGAAVWAVGDAEFDRDEELDAGGPDIDAAHEHIVWTELGRSPTNAFEEVTDWVETDFVERDVDGYRRTVIEYQIPLLDTLTGVGDLGSKPYREWTTIVQSTPWGVLGVSVHLEPTPQLGRSSQVAAGMMEDSLTRACEHADAVVTAFSRQAERVPDADTPAPWVHWDDMDDREQELLTLGAIESQLSRSESRVILGDLIEIISERYGAEEDSVRQAATRLKRLGRVGVDSGPVYQIVDMEAR